MSSLLLGLELEIESFGEPVQLDLARGEEPDMKRNVSSVFCIAWGATLFLVKDATTKVKRLKIETKAKNYIVILSSLSLCRLQVFKC